MVEITQKEFDVLRTYLKANYGISLGDEKKQLVNSRLRVILEEMKLNSFTEFIEILKNDKVGETTIKFINRITTNHTYFMREVEHFDFLKDTVLPELFGKNSTNKDFRLWCAACSSGEEAYTLEMIAHEYFEHANSSIDTRILATDISTNALQKAYAGIYKTENMVNLPSAWKKKYFNKIDPENSQVKDEIRKLITYRKLNLMDDVFPLSQPVQVIFCRNVMIYFDNETRDKLVNKFYDYIEPGGYLFVGHSESLNQSKIKFKYIKPAVYKKI